MSSKATEKTKPKEDKDRAKKSDKEAKDTSVTVNKSVAKDTSNNVDSHLKDPSKPNETKETGKVGSPNPSGDKKPEPIRSSSPKLEKDDSKSKKTADNPAKMTVQKEKSKETADGRDKSMEKDTLNVSTMKSKEKSQAQSPQPSARLTAESKKRAEISDGNFSILLLRPSNEQDQARRHDRLDAEDQENLPRRAEPEAEGYLRVPGSGTQVFAREDNGPLRSANAGLEGGPQQGDPRQNKGQGQTHRPRPAQQARDGVPGSAHEGQAGQGREDQAKSKARDYSKAKEIRDAEFHGAKSKAYLRVSRSVTKLDPNIQRIEQGQKVLEMRNQYSEIVRDVFFKDALVTQKSKAQLDLPKEAISTRDIKVEADKKRQAEYDSIKRRYELGEKYLEEIRAQNALVPESKRKELELRRFEARRRVPKPAKDRKYIDEVRRYYVEPKEIVAHKDLLKNLNPTKSSDSKVAVLKVVESLDSQIKQKEVRVKYKADQKHQENSLGDMYISSIQTKLNLLETQAKNKKPSKKNKKIKDLKTLMENESDHEGDF